MKLCPLAVLGWASFTGSALSADPSAPRAFDVMALRSASPVHFAALRAARGSLLLNLDEQKAECKGENTRATMYIQDTRLFLYSSDQPQRVFVDRSAMGQGIIRYIDHDQTAPQNAEFKGWSINADGNLVFDNKVLQACPGAIGHAWSVWTALVVEPAGLKGCLGFSPRALDNDRPVSCRYSTY